ncbi:hypothetical protein [Streptomyces fungicidicus]
MDPRTEVGQQWGRLTSWLRRHAPATHVRLRPPVTPEAPARHERRISRPLHDDQKALWELNEGAYLFGFPGFLNGARGGVGPGTGAGPVRLRRPGRPVPTWPTACEGAHLPAGSATAPCTPGVTRQEV